MARDRAGRNFAAHSGSVMSGKTLPDVSGWLLEEEEGLVAWTEQRFILVGPGAELGAAAACGLLGSCEDRDVVHSSLLRPAPFSPGVSLPLSLSPLIFAYCCCSGLLKCIQPYLWSATLFSLLSCISCVLLHWGFCLFAINIVYETHINNFCSSSFCLCLYSIPFSEYLSIYFILLEN